MLLALLPSAALGCSAYIAGRLATADGSVMVSHSDDGDGSSDPRISYIPPATHAANSTRPIWPDLESYPRFVGTARGATYAALPGQEETQPIGAIPQVASTHGYYEANYAIQNDCALMFGESTASAAFKAFAIGQPNGTALLSVNEMTRIAAERVCSSREAVTLMGDLATTYGFYGADGGAGETLMVGDPEEAFVFHVLSDPTAKSAVWVAQRVADEHVSVIANMFTIREVNLTDTHTFLGSANLHSVALAHGLWDGVGLLDFTKAYSKGEYTHKYYSGRRMWDGLRQFKPSLTLPPEYADLKNEKPTRPWGRSVYPWSVVPDVKLTPSAWFAAHRSHYEGTPYDTTKGGAAGFGGTPERYQTIGAAGDPGVGSWERTVSIYRTTYTWVVQAQANASSPLLAGIIWWGPADSSKTVFVPLMATAGAPPTPYTLGRQSRLDRGAAYWAHRYVQNLAQLHYGAMIADIAAASALWEGVGAALVQRLKQDAPTLTVADLEQRLASHAASVLEAWWQLADDLMLKYADGDLTVAQPDGSVVSTPLGYPAEWLGAVNFTRGPPRLPPPAGFDEEGADALVKAAAAAPPTLVAMATTTDGQQRMRHAASQPSDAAQLTRFGGFQRGNQWHQRG